MEKNKIEWESHYSRIKPEVDCEAHRSYDERHPYIKRMVQFARGKRRSLEFGSGKGGLSLILKRNFPELETYLLDFSEGAIESSRELFEYFGLCGQFYQGSFMELPFPDDHFDFIHGNTVLEHVENTVGAVRELTRVLAPGGVIMVTVPNRYRRLDGHDFYHFVKRLNYFSKTFYPRELKELFTDCSCRIVDTYGVGGIYLFPSFFLLFGAEMLRRVVGMKGNALKSGGIEVDGDGDGEKVDKLAGYRKLYKTVFWPFYLLDRLWGMGQGALNQFLNRNEILPESCCITIGIVAVKKEE